MTKKKPPPKRFPITTIIPFEKIDVYYVCPDDEEGKRREVDSNQLEVSAIYADCDMCGKHGNTTMTFLCYHCENYHEVTLTEQ